MDIFSRIFLNGWGIISVVLSLLGNTFVLVASKHGKAIKLDRVSIVLLENLAVADIGTSLFAILPYLILLNILNYGNGYSAYVQTLGSKIKLFFSLIFMSAGISLISFLNCCKLFSLRLQDCGNGLDKSHSHSLGEPIFGLHCVFGNDGNRNFAVTLSGADINIRTSP